MSFTEAQKAMVRKRAHFRCCLCHAIGVEVHHIVPRSEGGDDEADNAAPLCPTCHETYGGNPVKQKFIREARDVWNEICGKRFASDADRLDAISEVLSRLATKEDVAQLAIHNSGYVGSRIADATAPVLAPEKYSFEREAFVNPLIVKELLGWLSDPVATVIAVDLAAANSSNRFFGDFSESVNCGRSWVRWTGSHASFWYAQVGVSPSGTHIIECYDWPGGRGIFGSIGLFNFERDLQLVAAQDGLISRQRLLLKIVGAIPLGDRYEGTISYTPNLLSISADQGVLAHRGQTSRTFVIS